MALRYLVGSGNWSNTAIWSTTSGGAGGASVPGASDNAYLDTAHTVTLDTDVSVLGIAVGSVDSFVGTVLNIASYNLSIALVNPFDFYSGTINIQQGSISLRDFQPATAFSKTLDLGSGVMEFMPYFSTTPAPNFNSSSLTVDAQTGQVIINTSSNNAALTFGTSSKTFNDVTINLNGSSETVSITGSPTFRSLIIQSKNTAAHSVFLDNAATITTNKLVAIGSSSTNKLTIAPATGSATINFTTDGSSYGQYVNVVVAATGTGVTKYIGSSSTVNSGLGWTFADPPKISTLVDPLTTAPTSNTKWTVSGTIDQATSGYEGGGYTMTGLAILTSTDTYDFVDSDFIFEIDDTTNTGSNSVIWVYGGNSGTTMGLIARALSDAYSAEIAVPGNASFMLSSVFPTAFDVSSARYFKIRLNSSTRIATFSYSTDGSTWSGSTNSSAVSPDIINSFRSMRVNAYAEGSNPTLKLGSINPDFNSAPTVALSTPANNTTLTTTTPALTFTGTDADGDAVTYEVQVSTSSSFTSTVVDALSATDAGFSGTNPYTSGSSVTYTLQTALTAGKVDYYWRVRAKDPSGSNTWGAWSATNKMTTAAIAPTVTSSSDLLDTTNSIQPGGTITSDGGAAITENGVAYGLTANPTISGTKKTTSSPTPVGTPFWVIVSGLTSNTTYHWRAYATNSKGTTYGADMTSTTKPQAPTVTTGTPSGTTTNSFTITGSGVTSNPDSQTINEYGVVYDTSTNPTIANSSQLGTGTSASYTDTLPGLTENTTYYVRAYVKWGGTNYAYGNQVTYKTQQRPVTTLNSPSSSGTTDDTKPKLLFTGTDSDNDFITYQLQLNSTNSFTTPLIDALSASDSGFSNVSTTKADPFYAGNQIQYQTQTDLSRGASYWWRVRGKDTTGTNTWGDWTTAIQFTVNPILASLTTNGATNIDFDSADVTATINSDGGGAITERGVVYATTTNPTVADSKVVVAGTTSPYTANLTGLSGSTTYYARAYAINSVGTAYGNSITIQTAQTPSAPTVTTGSAASTTDITSNFNGNNVTLDGTFTVTERGIVFSDTNTTPDINDRKIVAPTAGLGSYDLKMTGLDPATLYYVRAYAINSFGTGYGSVVTFTTQDAFVPDEGDGYWSWAPGQSQATVGRTQSTPANSSVNLPLADLGLTDGTEYTFYFGSIDNDQGVTSVTIERYNDTTKIEDTVTAGTPFTFTYDESLIHWNIRLFVTDATAEPDNITAVFNDLYLAEESTFSGYVPFIPRGVTEVKIINNEIVDKRREDVISSIFDQVNGVSWYPFNIDTEGLGYFEIGDRFTITDDLGDSKSVVVWNTKLTVDGGISENLYTNKPDLTTTDYTKAGNSKLGGNLRKTQLQVDKQQGTIDALVSDMYTYDGVVNQKYTELLQDNESIIATVQGAGGVNLLKNSVMYAFDDTGVPDSWTMTGAGTLTIQASPESLSAGAVSGNQFSLSDKTATQTVTVRKDVDFIPEDEKTYYSISARVKKNTVGVASITLINRNETLTIDLPDQTSYFWDVVTLEAILPKDDHYDIAITSDSDADLQVTDIILAPGKTRHEWTQANGEMMNSSVAITKDGITIRSSALKNNYTTIDALGFEVHKQDAGGNRIFGFNDDETNVSKLKADEQIGMPPMRIVPISYSTYSGWAFTASEEI